MFDVGASDETPIAHFTSDSMAQFKFQPQDSDPKVVGSFGSLKDLEITALSDVKERCDIAEIRLDILEGNSGPINSSKWGHLLEMPLLFTARRNEEGGVGNLDARSRLHLLRISLEDAAMVDIEVASIDEMSEILDDLRFRQIPWIASYHDFHQLPSMEILEQAAQRAKDAGAAVFKAAAMLSCPDDLARLADFQLKDHGIPVATMGMGPLAPVSRLLCAQSGSLLNYGFLGETATAPGQWDSYFLKQAISRLVMINR
jgi:3-dehydroquinate dehydratase I